MAETIEICFSTVLVSGKAEIKVLADWLLVGALFLLCRHLSASSHDTERALLSPLLLKLLIPFLCTGNQVKMSVPTSWVNYLPKAPTSKYHYIVPPSGNGRNELHLVSTISSSCGLFWRQGANLINSPAPSQAHWSHNAIEWMCEWMQDLRACEEPSAGPSSSHSAIQIEREAWACKFLPACTQLGH